MHSIPEVAEISHCFFIWWCFGFQNRSFGPFRVCRNVPKFCGVAVFSPLLFCVVSSQDWQYLSLNLLTALADQLSAVGDSLMVVIGL
jgi:hypothetical protein